MQDNAAFVAAWKGCSSSTAVRHLDVEAPQLFQVTNTVVTNIAVLSLLTAGVNEPPGFYATVSGPAHTE